MACTVNEIHLDDVGTIFEITMQECNETTDQNDIVDISQATVMQILLRAPDGGVLTKTAIHSTDGTDGKMRYVTIAGDLDETGTWKIQGRVTLPTGTWSSDRQSFKVYGNLD